MEERLTKLFPHARIARMDSDLMKRKEDYRRVLGDFKAGKTDILLAATVKGDNLRGTGAGGDGKAASPEGFGPHISLLRGGAAG